MRKRGIVLSFILLAALSAIYVSNVGIAHAEISVQTELPLYDQGGVIVVSGNITDSDLNMADSATLKIIDEEQTVVQIDQFKPNLDGTFVQGPYLPTGPLWEASGTYTVLVTFGDQIGETTFEFEGGDGSTTVPDFIPEVGDSTDEEIEDPGPEDVDTTEEDVVSGVEDEGDAMDEAPSDGDVEDETSGCLIATAAFGSEMAPQVQILRELRDGTVLQTNSGISFLTGFNQFYYSFSPAVADLERDNPWFKETVKAVISPMIYSLTLLNYAEIDSEQSMLGYGIGIILLNIGMYFVAPAIIFVTIKNRLSKKY